ncbi:MAG TPA: ABC transporter permease [Nitrolancea sp.]|jgi:ABC-type nitrate/sulfonate/bicarbonate transport system permease component|nr:ABC transporter permease [Nitrolancea sp.]
MKTATRARWSRLISWAIPALLIAAVIVAWELIVRLTDTPRWFLPPPSAVVSATIDSHRLMLHHTWVTLKEVLVGFAISVVLGLAFALAIASSKIVERAFYPFVVASQAIPIIALAPILLIWFGYGLTPKVIVVALICFFPIVVNTVDGLRAVDPELVDLLRSMGASQWTIYRVIRIPSSLPYFFSGMRIAAAVSVIGALIGEWVGSSAGLGYLMIRSAAQFLTARVFAAVLISALLGLAMFGFVSLLERLLLPWQHVRTLDE